MVRIRAVVAGITGSIKTAHLWEAFGLRCKVHGSDIACLHTAWLEAHDEWGPGGFYYEMSLSLTRRGEDWLAVFAPRGRARFWAEYEAREHVIAAWRLIDPEHGDGTRRER